MPRNASGNYTLPSGNPVQTGTTIASTWANPTMSDIGNELQDSLSRTGKGAMQAPLKHTSGSAASPSVTFNAEPQSGWYRSATNDIRMSVGGVDAIRFNNGQLQVWNPTDSAFYPIPTANTTGAVVEESTLSAGQTVVAFTKNVAGAAIYLDATSGDRGRLLLDTDYTYDAVANEITLTNSQTDGTIIFAVINDETDVAAAATAASDSASAAATSEANAATSETNAANSASAAATSESNAATSETNAANSASAAATSESNAAASESAAATSASNAATSETNAANSASAASTSASNAATSETNAANSASAAATSESNAATSASNAATSESNAAASASAASDSADAAAVSAAESASANSARILRAQALLAEATLVGDFVGNTYEVDEGIDDGLTAKPFESIFDFTRDSDGTGLRSGLKLQTVTSDVKRLVYSPSTKKRAGLLIEESRTNLVEYSQYPTRAGWSPTELDVIPFFGLAKTGKLNASKLRESSANSEHYLQQIISGFSAGSDYSATFTVKPDGRNFVYLLASTFSGAFNGEQAWFNLSTGEVATVSGAPVSTEIKSLGGGVYACTLTVSCLDTGTGLFRIGLSDADSSTSYTGDGESGVEFISFDVQEGSFPTSYTPSTDTFTSAATSRTFYDSDGVLQTAGVDVARDDAYGYLDGTLYPIGLLLEDAATNLTLYSEDLTNAVYTNSGVTVTADAATAPDGNLTADQLAGAGILRFSQDYTVTAETEYTFSFFADDNGGDTANYRVRDLSNAADIVAETSYLSEISESGFVRITVSFTTPTGCTSIRCYNHSADSGTFNAFVWGNQVEQSPYATSYIPTAASTVTRAADVSSSAQTTRAADVCKRTLGAEFNNNEFSFFSEFSTIQNVPDSNNPHYVEFSDSSNDNRVLLQRLNGTNTIRLAAVKGGSVLFQVDYDATSDVGSAIKVGGALDDANVILTVNGNSTTGTTGESLPVMSIVNLGQKWDDSNHVELCEYAGFRAIPRAFTQSELEDITQ